MLFVNNVTKSSRRFWPWLRLSINLKLVIVFKSAVLNQRDIHNFRSTQIKLMPNSKKTRIYVQYYKKTLKLKLQLFVFRMYTRNRRPIVIYRRSLFLKSFVKPPSDQIRLFESTDSMRIERTENTRNKAKTIG